MPFNEPHFIFIADALRSRCLESAETRDIADYFWISYNEPSHERVRYKRQVECFIQNILGYLFKGHMLSELD